MVSQSASLGPWTKTLKTLSYPKQAFKVRFIQDSPSLCVFLTSPHIETGAAVTSACRAANHRVTTGFKMKYDMKFTLYYSILFSTSVSGPQKSFSGLRTQW